jgi:hypothetical protein
MWLKDLVFQKTELWEAQDEVLDESSHIRK